MYIYIYIYIHTCTYMYIYIYIYTHLLRTRGRQRTQPLDMFGREYLGREIGCARASGIADARRPAPLSEIIGTPFRGVSEYWAEVSEYWAEVSE